MIFDWVPSTYPERSLTLGNARPFVLHLSSRKKWRDLRMAGSLDLWLRATASAQGSPAIIKDATVGRD
jgi:hypothetical protein